MKPQKKVPLIVIVVLLSVAALLASFYMAYLEDKPFVIAVTAPHAELFETLDILTKSLATPVKLIVYDTENELMKAVYSGKVDAYSITLFAYIEQFRKLPSGRAILGIPSDYYLIAKTNKVIERPKVGTFDDNISSYLLSGSKASLLTYYNSRDCLNALSDDLIDYAIVHESYYDASKYTVINKMSALGFHEEVFVVTKKWIDLDVEENLSLIESFMKSMSLDILPPDETQLILAMTDLFKNEKIVTRYYYKDLVYTENH